MPAGLKTQVWALYHVAILYPSRRELAKTLNHLLELNIQLDGATDHGVSEAIYLRDPDQNGIELYWDKPREEWPILQNGDLNMTTSPLDIDSLLREI